MMKQQCWKQLRQQLCLKQKWIKDQQQSKCQHCTKQFIPIIRRRHHCRFCGNIFCSSCSDFFLNGKYLGLTQKFIRHCQFCHQKIQKFIKDCVKMPDLYQHQDCQQQDSDQQQDSEEFLEIDQQEQNYNLNKFFTQNQQQICSEIFNKIDDQIKKSIQKVSVILCQKFGLDVVIWSKKLAETALKAALQTKMDSFTSQSPYQSSMDIIKQVKIKSLVTQVDKITCILLKGLVLDKNLPSKHMPTHLSRPTILLIQNSINIQSFSSQMNFQSLIKNQKSIMKKIFQKISKLSPDIIFVQGNITFQAIQYFAQKKIAVVSKIKKKDLEAVRQMTSVRRVVKKLWLIQKYKPHNILGICDKIYFKNVTQTHTMMFIQADVGVRTIILGESTEELTNYLKKSMQLLLRFTRQMNLEKYLVSADNQLILTFPKNIKFPFVLELNREIYSCPQKFGQSQEVNFTKIVFGEIKYSIAPKNFIQYGQKIGRSVFFENCQNVQYQKKKIYASGDITLGGYLLLNMALNEKQCRKCGYSHTERYYFRQNVISIKFSKKPNISPVKSSIVNIDLQNQATLTLQRLKDALKKQKSKLVIQTFLYCQVCQAQLNQQPMKVGKNYLQNSFYYFICLLQRNKIISRVIDKEVQQKNQRSAAKKIRKLSMEKCQHDSLARVFQYSGCLVKFFIQPIQKFAVCEIMLKSQQGKQMIQLNQRKFLTSLKQTQINEKQALLEEIFSIINNFPFQNSTNSTSFSMAMTSMKFMQKMQRYQKCLVILQNLAHQFKKLKTLQISNDWTLFLRDIYKYEYMMKSIYQIMEYFQNYLKRKKIQDKHETQSMEEMMEKIDRMESSQDLDNDTSSNTFREHTFSQSNISFSSSTYLTVDGQKNRKQSQTADSKSHKVLTKIRKQRFPKYQGIFLKYTIGYTFAPVSVLACALNSPQFLTLYSQSSLTFSKQILKLKLQFSSKIKTSHPLKQQLDPIYKQIFQSDNLKQQTFEITIYYPDEFQKLRIRQGVNFQMYVRSLAGCQNWNSSGGKSNSSFAKSHNQILVVKIINNKEFVQFKKFAEDYVQYISTQKQQKKDSLLAKIYGIYEISMRGKQYKLVIMQNLFFGLQSICKVYDLKGSCVNRLTIPQDDKPYTGQDTNFKIDKDNTPYILQNQQYDQVIQVLQSDAKFLSQQQVIDYSLLVIQCVRNGKKMLRLGIIDFMRPYHIFQKIQNMYKKAKMGNDPTVIPPNQYGDRFFTAMTKYFIKVN